MRKAVLLLAAAAVAVSPAILGAQGQRYLNPRDVAEAQRQHPAMVQQLGGAETGPRAAYVESVGRRVAAFSGVANPGQALHFTTLNSPVENAFSVPGGYVYVTRQLLTLMSDESELAFALGHEVGHIAANHAHVREQYARSNPLGRLGEIISAVTGDNFFGGMLQQRAKLDTLRFSRDQEYQADQLGLRYMIGAGYDPGGGPGILATLSRQSALQTRIQGRTNRQTPEWASTHPLSANRMQQALRNARATGRLGTGLRNRDTFLREIEGMYVDDDPVQGIIDGATFTHPAYRIQFRVPQGYLMQNSTSSVTVGGSAGKAQFRSAPQGATIDQAVAFAFLQLAEGQFRLPYPQPVRTSINGIPAAYTTTPLNMRSGRIDVSVVAYQWAPQQVYYFVMLTPGGYGIGPFVPMVNSLRRITSQEAAAIRPRIIHVVTVAPGDTVQSLASRMAYRDFQLERFLSLNGLDPGSRLAPGQKVKLVVYGDRRA